MGVRSPSYPSWGRGVTIGLGLAVFQVPIGPGLAVFQVPIGLGLAVFQVPIGCFRFPLAVFQVPIGLGFVNFSSGLAARRTLPGGEARGSTRRPGLAGPRSPRGSTLPKATCTRIWVKTSPPLFRSPIVISGGIWTPGLNSGLFQDPEETVN